MGETICITKIKTLLIWGKPNWNTKFLLSNKKFLERAPAKVVENNRERLIEAHNVKGKVEEAIKRLEAF